MFDTGAMIDIDGAANNRPRPSGPAPRDDGARTMSGGFNFFEDDVYVLQVRRCLTNLINAVL